MTDAVLRDRRVLVVEDEYMIAEAMSRGLRRAGATVLGPVSNVAAALALLADDPDVDSAVLDINLGEQKVYPVVDALRARGARCVFATGNDPLDVPTAYAAVARCEKPVDSNCIVQALAQKDGQSIVDDSRRRAPLIAIREQLLEQISLADGVGETLVAAKLCEVVDVIDVVRRQPGR